VSGFPANMGFQNCDELCSTLTLAMLNKGAHR